MSVTVVNIGPSDLCTAEERSIHLKGNNVTQVEARPALELSDLSQSASAVPIEYPASTEQHKLRYRTIVAALFWCFFTYGLNDGSAGPLLPAYQRDYKIGFLSVSLIFVFNCTGFVVSSIAHIYLASRFTFGQLLLAGASVLLSGYAVLSPGGPFPLMCFGYFLVGCGLALLNAQINAFISRMQNPRVMGLAHASYGTGALISPLVSTQFAQIERWYFHYLFLLGATMITLSVMVIFFRGKSAEVILAEMGVAHHDPHVTTTSQGDLGFGAVMKHKLLHVMAAFVFVYVGTEVTVGGWIVTFLISERGGGAEAGYVSSGFFGGLAFGRIALLWVNRKVGERRVVFFYIALGMALEITIWFVPSMIENAVAVSIFGILLGPMYPIIMNHAGKVLPRKQLTPSVGWIAGFGQAGSAAFPFVTGLLASRYGIIALQPLIVSMLTLMTGLWFFIPGAPRRTE